MLLCEATWCFARGDPTDSMLWKSGVTAIELFSRVNFVEVGNFLPLLATMATYKKMVERLKRRGCDRRKAAGLVPKGAEQIQIPLTML